MIPFRYSSKIDKPNLCYRTQDNTVATFGGG